MHDRNRHGGRYDLGELAAIWPPLARLVARNSHGVESIDFADPGAVLALNQALLRSYYGISHWDLPSYSLCPPIPGRADYIHHAADLLALGRAGPIPRGPRVRVLDIGVGASCIYPIIGRAEYGWSFVGSDIDRAALHHARAIVGANPVLAGGVELRLQASSAAVFDGIVAPGERFDLSVCNPPFHPSPAAAALGTRRKLRNLASGKGPQPSFVRNFGGRPAELWCAGGELGFISRMISESARIPAQIRWFTALVSRSAHLSAIANHLRSAGAVEVRVIDMSQGQKKSRMVAWTFLRHPAKRRPASA